MNNKSTARKVSSALSFSLLIVFAILTCSFFIEFEYRTVFQIITGILLILLIFAFAKGGFFYLDTGVQNNTVLTLKHYNLFPFFRKFKLFQIPVKSLVRYEIKNYFFGLFSFLIIYEHAKKGIARYPAVGFSAVSKTVKNDIKELLNKLVKMSK